MDVPLVQQKWTLGDRALPLERKVLDLVDPSQNPPECRLQDVGFLLLSLKTSEQALWLTEYLGESSRWWRQVGHRQPLMQEIAQSYPKRAKGLLSSDTVIPIIVRGKEILVLNRRASPTLAFVESKGDFETLAWFLGELKKDLDSSDTVPRVPRSEEIGDGEKDDIEVILEDLKSHPKCRKAWFLPSVQAIEVHSSSKRSTKIHLKKALKKRGGATLEAAASQALAFLQGCDSKAGSSSSALEPLAMAVDGLDQECLEKESEKEDLEMEPEKEDLEKESENKCLEKESKKQKVE